MQSILIVDDEKHTRDGLIAALSDNYDVAGAANADEAFRLMDAQDFDAVVTDLRMSGKSGMYVLENAISRANAPTCIMMTAYGNIDIAVEAMKHGASDFITKPINIERLEVLLNRALKRREVQLETQKKAEKEKPQTENFAIKSSVKTVSKSDREIIAQSEEFKQVLEQAKKIAPTKASAMLLGETGTGKEIVAQFIHQNSPRANGAFVAVHCAAIPATLIESELFGYEKGAFTGAVARKTGKVEAANGGTLFLDEIGDIDAQTQVKLLRFLETRTIVRVGGVQEIPLDIRIICATNKNLKELVEKNEFREDLYYRLNVVELRLPALRDRKPDIEALLNFYTAKYADENSTSAPKYSKDALNTLLNYSWPGNIRELRNFCENIVVLHNAETIESSDLDSRFHITKLAVSASALPKTLSKKENDIALIKRALEESGGNKSKAADLLGISRRTLHRKLEELANEENAS